jgi:cytochrome P450
MLPPGPKQPRLVQTVGWMTRPGPFMKRMRDRYGDAFTLRIQNEGTWVLMSDPAAVKQVFTASPALLHAGEANEILGVRRCLGAAFAQFDMATVLRVIAARRARLAPDGPAPERVARRSITLVPERDGRVLVS